MELKEATYKSTEIGLIPEDWSDVRIGEILKIKHGKSQKEVESSNGAYPIYGTGGLMGYATDFLYDKESVLIGRKGTIDKPRYLDTPFWTVDTLFYSEIKEGVVAKLIYYNFLMIDWYSHNEASGVPSLNGSKIEKIRIPLPPTQEEQQAIANALSVVDTLISKLDKLIAKKKDIKQGAMQRLLKSPAQGGQRLPGFEGEWVDKSLEELTNIQTGSTPPTSDLSNYGTDYLFVSPADLGKEAFIKKTEKGLSKKGFQMSRAFPQNSVLFVCIGSTIGKTGIASKELTSNQQINAVFPSDSLYYLFAFYLLTYHSSGIKALAGEQAVPQINKSQFAATRMFVPEIDEQKAIASVLSDMNKEIESLEIKKTKYLHIKQGMMQELLTGKTRLV